MIHGIVYGHRTNLGQFTQVVGVQQQLLQAPGIPEYFFRYRIQRAVSLVDALHLPVAALEYRYATEHDNGQSVGDIILITTIANGLEDRPVQEAGRTMYERNDTSRSLEIHRRHSGRAKTEKRNQTARLKRLGVLCRTVL